jgi:hypothetical protein
MWALNPPAHKAFESLGRISGILLFGLSALSAATAIGLFSRKKWAWWLAVALFAINGAGDLVTLILTRDILRSGSGLLVAGVFLFFLTRPAVRQAFR